MKPAYKILTYIIAAVLALRAMVLFYLGEPQGAIAALCLALMCLWTHYLVNEIHRLRDERDAWVNYPHSLRGRK